MVVGTVRPGTARGMSDPLMSHILHDLDPQRLVGLFAFATIFVTLLALGASLRPLKVI